MKSSSNSNPPSEPRAQSTGPSHPHGRPVELPILNDPGLTAQGWERRHTTDAVRAAEAVEQYQSLGFEVRVENVNPALFGPQCAPCAETGSNSLVVIFTRRKRVHLQSHPSSDRYG